MYALIRHAKLVAIISVVLLVSACATSQPLSDTDRAKFKSTKISAAVNKGQLFLLAPSGANIGLMFGLVGGLAAAGPIEESRQVFATYLEKNSISIERVVREEIETALRQSGKIAIVSLEDPALPTINISVPQYGFGVTHLLSSNVVPVIQIQCDMIDNSGRVLWSASDRMLPSIASPMESTTWEQLRDNPKQIEEQWRKASRFLANKIVAEL